jgi:hypothetical protein
MTIQQTHRTPSLDDVKHMVINAGGEWRGKSGVMPTPGHSRADRGISVKHDPSAPYGVLVNCFNGDAKQALHHVLDRLGIPNGHSHKAAVNNTTLKRKPAKASARKVASYDYVDENGEVVGTKHRYEPKGFAWNPRPSAPIPPYGLPRLLEHADQPIWLVEGEKDADRLNSEGLVAVSIEQGYEAEAARFLEGRTVFILPDNDEAGEKRAAKTLDALKAAVSARIVRLPGLAPKGDVSDWLDTGNTISELIGLSEDIEIADGADRLAAAFTMFEDISLGREPVYLIDDVLPLNGIGVIYGPSGVGKSHAVADIAMSVARGVSFAGQYDVQQGGVIYIALEGRTGFERRIEAYKRTHGVNRAEFAILAYPLEICDEQSVTGLVDLLDHWKKTNGSYPRLVVFDTLARAMPGRDENSSTDMGAAIRGMQRISDAINGLVLAVHHSGKDVDRGGRGHSSLRAALDVELQVKGSKTDPVRELYLSKLKDGPDDRSVASFKLKQVILNKDRKGRDIVSAIIEWVNERRAQQGPELTPPRREIVNCIEQLIANGKFTTAPNADGFCAGKQIVKIEDLIDRCVKTGRVTTAEKPENAIRKQLADMGRAGVLGMFDGKVWLIRGLTK